MHQNNSQMRAHLQEQDLCNHQFSSASGCPYLCVLYWTKQELKNKDYKTRKLLTIHGLLHLRLMLNTWTPHHARENKGGYILKPLTRQQQQDCVFTWSSLMVCLPNFFKTSIRNQHTTSPSLREVMKYSKTQAVKSNTGPTKTSWTVSMIVTSLMMVPSLLIRPY